MTLDDNDPDIVAGRAIAAGKPPQVAAETEDPDIVAGRAIAAPSRTAAATTRTDPYTESGYAPNMTWRGTAKEIAAAGPRIAGNVINLLSDPYANLVGYPLTVAGQTA